MLSPRPEEQGAAVATLENQSHASRFDFQVLQVGELEVPRRGLRARESVNTRRHDHLAGTAALGPLDAGDERCGRVWADVEGRFLRGCGNARWRRGGLGDGVEAEAAAEEEKRKRAWGEVP